MGLPTARTNKCVLNKNTINGKLVSTQNIKKKNSKKLRKNKHLGYINPIFKVKYSCKTIPKQKYIHIKNVYKS